MNYCFGNRTRDLPACSAVPQPTTPPRATLQKCACVKWSNTRIRTVLSSNVPHPFASVKFTWRWQGASEYANRFWRSRSLAWPFTIFLYVRSLGWKGYLMYTVYILTHELWVIFNDMIYLLTASGLSPGGRSTVHIYTQTMHRTIQNKQYIEQHNNFGRVRAVPRLG